MLFGEFKWADGISYFFIRSAAAIHAMEPAPDHLVFDDAVWAEVHDVMEKYFKNQQILGWALSLPGYGEDLNEQIIRAHLNHFGGNDKTLFRVNGQEKRKPSIRTRAAPCGAREAFTFIMKRMSRCSRI